MARERAQYDRSPGAVYRLRYHTYFVTKRRRKVLVGAVRDRVFALVRAKCAELGFTLDAVGVSADHVHVMYGAPPKWSPAEVARRLKGATSRELGFATHCAELPLMRIRRVQCVSAGRLRPG